MIGEIAAGLNIVGGIFGALSSRKAKKRAEEARRAALERMMVEMARTEEDARRNASAGLMGLAGKLGDSLKAQGGALGSSMAQAGVYNSSAVAGALSNQANENSSILRDVALKSSSQLQQLRAQAMSTVYGNEIDFANQQIADAQAGMAAYGQMIGQGLGGLDAILGKRSAPAAKNTPKDPERVASGNFLPYVGSILPALNMGRTTGPAMNGMQNATLPLLLDPAQVNPLLTRPKLAVGDNSRSKSFFRG